MAGRLRKKDARPVEPQGGSQEWEPVSGTAPGRGHCPATGSAGHCKSFVFNRKKSGESSKDFKRRKKHDLKFIFKDHTSCSAKSRFEKRQEWRQDSHLGQQSGAPPWPAVPPPAAHPRTAETHVHANTWTRTITAASFTIAKRWKQLQCPSTGEKNVVYSCDGVSFGHRKG